MRSILLISLIILASGCLEGQLSPSQAQQCLLSTSVEPSLLPKCESTFECEKKLAEGYPNAIFQNIPVGIENIRARKGIAGTWNKIQKAAKMVERIHQSCATLEAAALLPEAVTGASELQNALKTSEEAQTFTYLALEKSMTYGASLDLDDIKDTRAFEKFTKLLQKGHELQTKNPASEWGLAAAANQNYFEKIAQTIAQNKAGQYRVEWSSVFKTYQTGVATANPDRARIVTMVSPLWQGALSAFIGKSKSLNALTMMSEIQANEVVEHVEQMVAPENGIVVQIWKDIQAFDQEISELKEEEKKVQKNIQIKMSKIKEVFVRQKTEDDKWNNLKINLRSWAQLREKLSPNADYWDVENEWNQLVGKVELLNTTHAHQTKSIGKRMAEWRKIDQEIESIVQKMHENNLLSEKWMDLCKQELLENKINLNGAIQNADECQSGIDILKRETVLKIDEKKQLSENELQWCVSELNEMEQALEKEETTMQWFTAQFDEAGAAACESARMNTRKIYENTPLVREWLEIKKKLETTTRGIEYASNTIHDWDEKKNTKEWVTSTQKWLNENKEPFNQNELQSKIKNGEEKILEQEKILDKIIQEAAHRIKWKVIEPNRVHANQIEEVTIEGHIFAFWGGVMNHSFVVSFPNPGIQLLKKVTEPTQGTLSGDEIILDGTILPGREIVINGMGSHVAAQVVTTQNEAKIIGIQARVTQVDTLTTLFAPIHVRWEWKPPAGMEGGSEMVTVEGKIIIPNEENGKKIIQIETTTEKTIILYKYTVNNAIVVESSVKNQKNEWGRTYTEYETTIKNSLAMKVNAAIHTGINGDPLLTESIFITNENGEKIPYTLDAASTIILPNQNMESNEIRKYSIVIEMMEGMEEWESVIVRLRLELDQLKQSREESIVKESEYLLVKLTKLQQEKNGLTLAEKLIPIQTAVSELLLREEEYEKEWAVLEETWKKLIEKNPKNNAEWAARGNTALINRNKNNLLEAIQEMKLQEMNSESAEKAEAKIIDYSEQEKVMEEVNKLVEMTQKNIGLYEKGLSIGCEKLQLINFMCPITEETFRNDKKMVNSDAKSAGKLETKWSKLSIEKKSDEWNTAHAEWERVKEEVSEINTRIEKGLRVLQNTAIERVAKLKFETKEIKDDAIVSSVEKATSSIESGEFGKSIFIAQSTLNYVNGNKMTGLTVIPPLAWPFIGIIAIVSAWTIWKEWKKKTKTIIPTQTIPREKIIPDSEMKNDVSERQPMQEEFQQRNRETIEPSNRLPLTMPAPIAVEKNHPAKNLQRQLQTGRPR